MWSACSSMMRKNWTISAGSSAGEAPSTVAAEPLMEVSGARSSWLTMPRNSARRRSSSSTGVRSWRVTTTGPALPWSPPMRPALTSTLTPRPAGPESTISSARSGAPFPSSFSAASRPSPNRHLNVAASRSAERPPLRSPSTIRLASRLSDTGLPLRASKTTTPTGEVSSRVSRSARARRSLSWARALAMALAAWEANSTRISSSSPVNSCPPSLPPRQKLPTCSPRARMGVAWKLVEGRKSAAWPRERT